MKKSLLPLVFLLIVNCGTSKTEKPIKIKIFKNNDVIVNYPNTWVMPGLKRNPYFMPKTIEKNTYQNEIEHVSIFKRSIPVNDSDDIEKILYHYGETINRNEKFKNFRLVKLQSSSKFIYKIESLITYNFISGNYKREEYFYLRNGELGYFKYQMREDLFDFYHDDAMLIINSVQHKK